MSNESGDAAGVLTCPTDERTPVQTFKDCTNNSSLSYFVGILATARNPQSILGGDRNLGPGTVPQDDYGFSPANGRGSNVTLTGPACWSLKMHSQGNTPGRGNNTRYATPICFRLLTHRLNLLTVRVRDVF